MSIPLDIIKQSVAVQLSAHGLSDDQINAALNTMEERYQQIISDLTALSDASTYLDVQPEDTPTSEVDKLRNKIARKKFVKYANYVLSSLSNGSIIVHDLDGKLLGMNTLEEIMESVLQGKIRLKPAPTGLGLINLLPYEDAVRFKEPYKAAKKLGFGVDVEHGKFQGHLAWDDQTMTLTNYAGGAKYEICSALHLASVTLVLSGEAV